MSSTDYLRLNDHKIFSVLRETLPKQFKKTQNLLAVKDDVLYTWDFQDNCVLCLNIKAFRSRVGDNVFHQTLLPTSPPLFTPEHIIVNDNNTLVAVWGLFGVLVFELPERYPPYGAFGGNKEVVYCRSFSLHERVLAFSSDLEVRQVRFHPGCIKGIHILILTSDNTLRLCKIDNSVAIAIGVYSIGIPPVGKFPTTKRLYLEEMGETAVDYDFAPPELKLDQKNTYNDTYKSTIDTYNTTIDGNLRNTSLRSTTSGPFSGHNRSDASAKTHESNKRSKFCELEWPVYILHGNGSVYVTSLHLNQKSALEVKGPLHSTQSGDYIFGKDYCAILCVPSTPAILCIANCNGTITHSVVLPVEDCQEAVVDDKVPYKFKAANQALYLFETIEIELGLATNIDHTEYSCPVLLHRDYSNVGSYFATHETGVHFMTINCIENLHKFINSNEEDSELVDLLKQPSSAEYMICTKTTSSHMNPVIGFALYYDPISIITILGKGQLVSLAVVLLPLLPSAEDLEKFHMEAMNSPLKKMLSNPFDVHIQKILKQASMQPILKLSPGEEQSQQDCYELLQRACQVFRDQHFKKLELAHEEIEKRVRALQMLKKYQKNEIQRMDEEKQALQEKAGSLAERYEDIKDKQDELTKRCEKLLIMLSRKQVQPSNAEQKLLEDLKIADEKMKKYVVWITKLRNKTKYQEVQMDNWKRNYAKESVMDSVQTTTIRNNLQDMTNKITNLMKEVNECKDQLNL